jgi:hypothetical protein
MENVTMCTSNQLYEYYKCWSIYQTDPNSFIFILTLIFVQFILSQPVQYKIELKQKKKSFWIIQTTHSNNKHA